MINRFAFLIINIFVFFSTDAYAQKESSKFGLDSHFINQQLQAASKQIRLLDQATPHDKFPKSFANSKHEFSNSSWWCSGFFPGTLLLLAEETNDQTLLEHALNKLSYLEKEQFNKGTHDLGFMLYCSFGNALRLTQDSA
ncbi:MAG: glucuronyl hydrolase, partial [Sphingobacterium sp.]